MLKITVMKTPSVELDGVPVSFPFKRADALLYYMAVQKVATRQELVALLWEDCDESNGLKQLRNILYHLKKILGGDFLISPQKSIIRVNPEWQVDCDYDRFVRDHDLSAYGGEFLQGFGVKRAFSFEEWMCRTADRLREQYLEQVTAAAEKAMAQGPPPGSSSTVYQRTGRRQLQRKACRRAHGMLALSSELLPGSRSLSTAPEIPEG